MKTRKYLLSLAICMVIAFTLSAQVSAHNDYGNSIDLPIAGTSPNNGIPETPGGVLKSGINSESQNVITPNHVSPLAHFHYVDSITNTYDGYNDRGEVASGYNGQSNSDSLSFSINRIVSNGWNVNLGFSKSVVDAAVGYNTEWSTEKTFAYSSTVSPKKTVHIGYQDWYHVKEFNTRTLYIISSTQNMTEYGTGWSKQWYKYHFYSWET